MRVKFLENKTVQTEVGFKVPFAKGASKELPDDVAKKLINQKICEIDKEATAADKKAAEEAAAEKQAAAEAAAKEEAAAKAEAAAKEEAAAKAEADKKKASKK